jgi:hypothetical protein
MHGTNSHPYIVQSAAFFVALIPFALLFTMIAGAKFFDGLRRARKPAPARPPAIVSLARPRIALAD